MNPLEYVDYIEDTQIKKIQDDEKEQYTKEEVIALLKDVGHSHRKAIYNGEYILDIESLDESHITVGDKECSIQKLISGDKYLLFIQINDVTGDFTQSDIEIMGEEIQKAIEKTNNIIGVVMLPPNVDVSVITAKLNSYYYAKNLNFTDEDLNYFKKGSMSFNNDNGYWYTTYDDTTSQNITLHSSYNDIDYSRIRFL